MSVQITGKNFDIGAALREHVDTKLHDAVSKYVQTDLEGHVRFEKERNSFKTSCSIQLGWGLLLQATGEGGDAYASCDAALERIEKRLRRYKRRIVNKHHSGPTTTERAFAPAKAVDYTIEDQDDSDDALDDVPDAVTDAAENGEAPVIVAERET
ncbi:MAG: ribosome-associated translation inhibitor RaiA, partial [Pseudomonadota bacterium]